MNAENVLEVHDPALADQMAAFVDEAGTAIERCPRLAMLGPP